jgi:hypothetical protein
MRVAIEISTIHTLPHSEVSEEDDRHASRMIRSQHQDVPRSILVETLLVKGVHYGSKQERGTDEQIGRDFQ